MFFLIRIVVSIFFLCVLHEISISLFQFTILEPESFLTFVVMSFVVVDDSLELPRPSFFEVWNLCNDWVRNTGNVKKKDNQVRLFTLNSLIFSKIPFLCFLLSSHCCWKVTWRATLFKHFLYLFWGRWRFAVILDKLFSFFYECSNVSEIILVLIVR